MHPVPVKPISWKGGQTQGGQVCKHASEMGCIPSGFVWRVDVGPETKLFIGGLKGQDMTMETLITGAQITHAYELTLIVHTPEYVSPCISRLVYRYRDISTQR